MHDTACSSKDLHCQWASLCNWEAANYFSFLERKRASEKVKDGEIWTILFFHNCPHHLKMVREMYILSDATVVWCIPVSPCGWTCMDLQCLFPGGFRAALHPNVTAVLRLVYQCPSEPFNDIRGCLTSDRSTFCSFPTAGLGNCGSASKVMFAIELMFILL